jgi:hypothetical protein
MWLEQTMESSFGESRRLTYPIAKHDFSPEDISYLAAEIKRRGALTCGSDRSHLSKKTPAWTYASHGQGHCVSLGQFMEEN